MENLSEWLRTAGRVQRVSLDMTAAFEGSYDSYQTYDGGGISYGRFQFTLTSGSLFTVVEQYVNRATTSTADELQKNYLNRLRQRDKGLKNDPALKTFLLRAARERTMQQAQDAVAVTEYWEPVQELSITPRNIQLPLSKALIFDMAINHGLSHDMLTLAEEEIGVPPKSRMPDNGGDERELVWALVEIRRERLYNFAEANNFGGLKVRADFWVSMVKRNDWLLFGDEIGQIYPKRGRTVRVY